MSWVAVCTASMRLLMLCLFTCVAYRVTFRMETKWTKALHCEDCIAISWLILVLILHISLVVAVPVSQLRVVPRNGNKLLLHRVMVCGWFELSKLTADVIIVLLDLYMSCMLDNSNWSVVSSCVDADGCCSKDLMNCWVLVSCLLKSFQWHSKFPSHMCTMMIQECLVGYACKTGLKDHWFSWFSLRWVCSRGEYKY